RGSLGADRQRAAAFSQDPSDERKLNFPFWCHTNQVPKLSVLPHKENSSWEEELEGMTMKTRLFVAAAVVAPFAIPAFAADAFYIVQNVKTKKCTVVDKKPTESSMTIVSPAGTLHKTKAEAEAGMKTVKVCSS